MKNKPEKKDVVQELIAIFQHDIPSSFFDEIDFGEHGDCWNWKGRFFKNQTIFRHQNKTYFAHRIMCGGMSERLPITEVVIRRCKNARCVNPQHLTIKNRNLNLQEWNKKLAAHKVCKNGHTKDQAMIYIRDGKKKCRLCKRLYERYWKQERRAKA